MAMLEALNGPTPGKRFPLTKDRSVMGRHPDCEVVVEEGAVSRQHAQILAIEGEFFAEDLKSRNGTHVNDQLIEGRHLLKDQDQVRICDMVFTFHNPPMEATVGHMPGLDSVAMIDDAAASTSSTILTKLDVSSQSSGLRVSVRPEVKLRALLEITQNMARSLDLDAVLPKILDSLFKVFAQADRGFIMLKEAADGPLIPKAVKYRHGDSDQTVRLSRTIVNEAMNGKQAILSSDAARDSRFGMSESIADFRIRSMMCAPLVDNDGRSLGLIQIDTMDQRARFQQEDLDVLVSVATQAAVAVENAHLHETALRQQAMDRDLSVARRVQQGFLPSAPPNVEGYEFFDSYVPAQQVGGDYYDYVRLADNRLGVIVADVSGKGISAALLMAKVSAEARYWLASEKNPAEAVKRLNASFSASGWDDRFVTLVLSVLDLKRHQVTVVNAGHMAPLLRHHDGSLEAIGEELAGVPIGVDGDFAFESCTVPLAAGDSLTSFTDGISEAMNSDKALYGIQRIQERLRTSKGMRVAEFGKEILDDVRRFVGKHPQSDDMCLVCVGRLTT